MIKLIIIMEINLFLFFGLSGKVFTYIVIRKYNPRDRKLQIEIFILSEGVIISEFNNILVIIKESIYKNTPIKINFFMF